MLWAGGVVAGRCAGVVVVVGVGAGFVCERGVVVAPRWRAADSHHGAIH